ncbi:ABC transporter permease [Solibaculum mannosilyticum]
MTLGLETTKIKRTGYVPAFLCCGLLASAFPLVNMLVRPEAFTALSGNPFSILMDANWQMMAMLNILALICGACVMYHTEYADNGTQKMDVLPVRTGSMFLGKFTISALLLATMIVLETAVLTGCAVYWFPSYEFNLLELLQCTAFQWFITLPTVMLMLVIASACKNMWVSLGIGVILVFTLSILPQENLVLSLFPFSSPYQAFATVAEQNQVLLFLGICAVETAVLGIAELLYQKIRRCYE